MHSNLSTVLYDEYKSLCTYSELYVFHLHSGFLLILWVKSLCTVQGMQNSFKEDEEKEAHCI